MNNTSINCDVILAKFPPPPPPVLPIVKSLYCLLILTFSLITLIGNILVITAVAIFKSLQKRIYAFVVSIACADIGVAAIVMPFRLYEEWNGAWYLGNWLCLTVNMLDGIFCSVSIGTLCCLAVERYLAVCKPFLYTKLTAFVTILVIVACWSISGVLWCVLIFKEYIIIGLEDLAFCASFGACPLVLNVTSALGLSLLTFWTPSVVMLFCYWKILATANRHLRAIRETMISDEEKRAHNSFSKKTKAAKTLGIVIGCYFLCWLPFFVVLAGDVVENYQWPVRLKIFVMWLGYLNSMMNPCLYYIFSAEFKKAFKVILHCKKNAFQDMSIFTTNVGDT